MPTTLTHGLCWLTLARALVNGLISGPDGQGLGSPENRGPMKMEHMHPSLLSPRQSLGKAKARARRPLIAPRIMAPTFQAPLIHVKRDGNWFMPREAIEQHGKTINTSCQFTYSFF